jgi:hypothetical protein
MAKVHIHPTNLNLLIHSFFNFKFPAKTSVLELNLATTSEFKFSAKNLAIAPWKLCVNFVVD